MHGDLNAEARTEVAMNGCGPRWSSVQPSRCDWQRTVNASHNLGAVCQLVSMIGALVDRRNRKSPPQRTRLLMKRGGWRLEERGSRRTTGGSGRV